jgi:hypothetical protein
LLKFCQSWCRGYYDHQCTKIFTNNTRIHDSTLPTAYLPTSYKYLPYIPPQSSMHSIPLPTYATYLPTYPTYPTHPTHPTYPTPYDPRINAPR